MIFGGRGVEITFTRTHEEQCRVWRTKRYNFYIYIQQLQLVFDLFDSVVFFSTFYFVFVPAGGRFKSSMQHLQGPLST